MRKLKQKIKSFLRKSVTLIRKLKTKAGHEIDTQVAQIQIVNQYILMKKLLTPEEMPGFKQVGFKVFSEYEEDGILLYIFSLIGTTNKRVVEICASDGTECMAANLVINHGWEGLLFDGDAELVKRGKHFFGATKSTAQQPPVFKQAWITRENINTLIEENGFTGNIDLLSLDIDGNDYYVMDAISVVKPRVIICETNNVIPAHLALTIPYKSDFSRGAVTHHEFLSVSLLAMKKLLNRKGYRFVGTNRFGFNAFFILNGLGEEYFPEVSVESVYDNPFTRLRSTVWNDVKHLPWVEV